MTCLLRQFAFASAELAPEASAENYLAHLNRHRGTEAYRNVIGLLALAQDFAVLDDERLRLRYPELAYVGADERTTLATLRRFAEEALQVCRSESPDARDLLGLG